MRTYLVSAVQVSVIFRSHEKSLASKTYEVRDSCCFEREQGKSQARLNPPKTLGEGFNSRRRTLTLLDWKYAIERIALNDTIDILYMLQHVFRVLYFDDNTQKLQLN